MSDLVSIIIPARGDLKFFSQTLKSIEDSIYRNFEVVVIDDGILPDTKTWIAKYCKDNPRYKIIQNNGVGIVDALNTGISNSSGIYIARLDADDCIRSDRLEIQVDFLNMNPQIGVLGSQVTYINEVGRQFGDSQYLNGYVFKSPQSFKRCSIAHPSVMIRRSVLVEVGGYSSLLKYKTIDFAEDFFLWLRISKITSLFNINESLTFYRQHDNQVSNFKLGVTSFASLLVFIKSIDHQNSISTPIYLEELSDEIRKSIYSVCLKRLNFSLVLLVKLRLLETSDSKILSSYASNLFARLLSRILGFNRSRR
jgi:glycosyltransferase involved in cell wall biosynthesis